MKIRVGLPESFYNDEIGICLGRVEDLGKGVVDLIASSRGRAKREITGLGMHLDSRIMFEGQQVSKDAIEERRDEKSMSCR